MHQNPWWLTPEGPTLDSGAFVAGLEFATETRARIVGKPHPEFFSVAITDLRREVGRDLARADIAMVGDDVRSDVRAAQRAGLRGIFVLSGKHGIARHRDRGEGTWRASTGCRRERPCRRRRRAAARRRLTATFRRAACARVTPDKRDPPTMTSEAKPRIKITYATLRADNEEMHSGFEEAVTKAKASLGTHYRNYIDGAWRDADDNFDVRSPIDRDLVLGTFAKGTKADIDDAVAAARAAQPAWAATPWQERLTILRRAAELISDRLMDYSAAMAIEVGKNRIEALGEVEESADLIRYYAQTMEDNGGLRPPDGQPG